MSTSKVILKNGQTIEIRNAMESDAKDLVGLFNQMGGESDNLTFGNGDYYLNETQERLFIRALKERTNSIFLVAVLEDKLIGYLTLATIQRGKLAHRGELGIGVLKEYWSLGVGAGLMEYLLQWAKGSSTVTKIELQVKIDNAGAIELYKRFGFAIEGTIQRGMKMGDEYFDLYYMGKILDRQE